MSVNDYERSRLFTRRALLIGGGQLGLFGVFAARLYQLQILDAAHYTTLAEENRINLRLISPPRGQILDRFGVPLAVNQQNFRAVIDPDQMEGGLVATLERLGKLIPISDADRRRIQRELKTARAFNGTLVADNLSWDQVAAIEINTPDLPAVRIESGEVRAYPYGAATSHILGYVGAVSDKEMTEDPLLALPAFRIGKSGIEKQRDLELRGTAGTQQMEVDAHGRVVRELAHTDPQPGHDLLLTLDIGLQQFAQNRLAVEQSAAAVVMDVHTGGIYALASHPGFDPNLFTYGISQSDWKGLNEDERAPLSNKAVSGLYAPGSAFKMMTAMAALEAGLVDANYTVFCPGYMELGNHRFHCWKRGGHGTVNLVSALAGSCDTYFYDLGKRVGIDKIEATARRFGLGQKTGVDLPHERAGVVPNRAWKQARRRGEWQQGETLINAIGQGFVLASPLQLAVMAARLANGGKAVVPHLTKQIKDGASERVTWPDIGVDQENLALVLKAMDAVTNSHLGTAREARITEPGMEMAGKTGTAQVRRITMAERAGGVISNENLPWKERDHALFVGFAPVSAPRYAVAVVVEHGGSGAHTAAPIARDILLECQKRDPARIGQSDPVP